MTTSSSPVAVVGCGLMGSGIAEVLARAGRPVLVHEVDDAAAARGRARIEASVSRAVRSGKLEDAVGAEVVARIEVGTDLDALADAAERLLHLDELRAAADDVNLGAFLDDTIQPQFPQVAEDFPGRIYGS